MWKYDETSVVKVADIGCDSYRSIKKVNGVLYWTDSNTSGGTSQNMYNFGGYGGRMLDGKYATLSIHRQKIRSVDLIVAPSPSRVLQ